MGWKLSTIFINSNKEINDVELFNSLGFQDITPIEPKAFEEILNPEDGELYIGHYKDSTILCIPTLPYLFLEASLSNEESILMNTFPNTDISSLVLQSVVNFWGFTLIKDGTKVRAKGGSSEEGLLVDFGTPLKEELELLKNSKINADGERVYHLDAYPDEEFTEDELGEEYVFKVCERYIGATLDHADDLLFETKFRGYSYKDTHEDSKQSEKIEKKTKWIKFIIYIAIFFILRFAVKHLLE
ncbi:DUF6928 family protein [Lacinutrix himadriensis]|uniref:DUF6928 family protein n=1 Tax=Lacinutrix himadriensis TaxID=641549 RepID=UPI0006E45374|nr:hypothetical protein [Lacinutrix himadriensis]